MSISFFSLYKKLADREVKISVELKNGICITGSLYSVDSNMNVHLRNIECEVPQFQNSTRCFIRGNNVKTMTIKSEDMHTLLLDELLQQEMATT